MNPSRRGVSLIEMLGVLTILSTLLVAVSVWLVSLFRASDLGREHLLILQSQDRLARQFRQDVHRATEWSRPGGETQGVVQLAIEPRHTIEYQLSGGRLVREESSDGTRLRRESYLLPLDSAAALEASDQSTGTQLALVIASKAATSRDGSPRATRIAAELGWLRRLSQGTSREDAP